MLTAALLLLAAAAGITGAWSPCGFSMVETARGLAARAAFSLGAITGGAITFGSLALIGSALGAGGPAALAVAAFVAVAAAAGEARGLRITPQIRRQVPESWRRIMPLPLASAGYGVLLGLGFTTFVLSFAVWALAALCVAIGQPLLGLAVGLAFGAGRALPVIFLRAGGDLHTAMAERPSIYRALRLADAAALVLCAAALTAEEARAATTHVTRATDPASAGGIFAWHEPGAGGRVSRDGRTDALPGGFPALGAGLLAWRESERIVFADPITLERRGETVAPGWGPFAFGERWLAWLADREGGGDSLLVQPAFSPGTPSIIASVEPPASIGRPSVDGDRIYFHIASRSGSRIVEVDLATNSVRHVRSARSAALLLNPSVEGRRLVYVRSTSNRQELRYGTLARRSVGRDRVLYSTVPTGRRDSGHEPGLKRHRKTKRFARPRPGVQKTLWTTALDAGNAYVTRLIKRKGRQPTSTIVRAARPGSRVP